MAKTSESSFGPWNLLLWVSAGVLAYLLASGPVTRWLPEVADRVYAPLAVVARSRVLGAPLRAYLRFWGVDLGE